VLSLLELISFVDIAPVSGNDFNFMRFGAGRPWLWERDEAFATVLDDVLMAIFSIRIVGALGFELDGFFFQKDI